MTNENQKTTIDPGSHASASLHSPSHHNTKTSSHSSYGEEPNTAETSSHNPQSNPTNSPTIDSVDVFSNYVHHDEEDSRESLSPFHIDSNSNSEGAFGEGTRAVSSSTGGDSHCARDSERNKQSVEMVAPPVSSPMHTAAAGSSSLQQRHSHNISMQREHQSSQSDRSVHRPQLDMSCLNSSAMQVSRVVGSNRNSGSVTTPQTASSTASNHHHARFPIMASPSSTSTANSRVHPHPSLHQIYDQKRVHQYSSPGISSSSGEMQQQDSMISNSPISTVSNSSMDHHHRQMRLTIPSPLSTPTNGGAATSMRPNTATTPSSSSTIGGSSMKKRSSTSTSSSKKEPDSARRKRRRASRQFSRSEFMSVMHLTQAEAAAHFNVCLSTWKRQFCNLRPRLSWPGHKKRRMLKKIRKLQLVVDALEESEEVLPGKLFQFGHSIDDLYTHLVEDPRNLLQENKTLRERVSHLEAEIARLKAAKESTGSNRPCHVQVSTPTNSLSTTGTPMSSTPPPRNALLTSASGRSPQAGQSENTPTSSGVTPRSSHAISSDFDHFSSP